MGQAAGSAVHVPPQQLRSIALVDAILVATRSLLDERPFEQISIVEITARAQISVGAFYSRFKTKEHLLAHCAHDVAERLADDLEAALKPSRPAVLSVYEIAEVYFGRAAIAFVENRDILRPLVLAVRAPQNEELAALVSAFNARAHGAFVAALRQHERSIAHRDAAAAVEFAIRMVSAGVREAALFQVPPIRTPAQINRLATESARAFSAYLTANSAT